MAEGEEGFTVTVLARRDVKTFPKLDEPVVHVYVTYIAAGLPPGNVMILKEEYDLSLEKKLIGEDIEKRRKEKPEVYRI